jgi:predicted GNAT family acetyltransferase
MTATPRDTVMSKSAERHRYEMSIGGELAAFIDYRDMAGGIELVHTKVMPAHEGHGVGSRLAKFALEEAGREGRKVKATCRFIAKYIERHPEYGGLRTA